VTQLDDALAALALQPDPVTEVGLDHTWLRDVVATLQAAGVGDSDLAAAVASKVGQAAVDAAVGFHAGTPHGGATTLDGLSDVDTAAAADGLVLTHDGAGWVAEALPASTGGVADDDPRLSDQRVPTDGSVTLAKTAAALQSPAAGTHGLRVLGTTATSACAGNDSRLSDQRVPTDASVTAAKVAAALVSPAAGTAGLRTLGTSATSAAAGNDTRLSDARTPTDASVTQAKLATALAASVPAVVRRAAAGGSWISGPTSAPTVTHTTTTLGALRPRPITWRCPVGAEPTVGTAADQANADYGDVVETFTP